ncbi:aldehyde dehydrogenase family protein [Bradyrhizobium sp. F1.4.3]|uniref:aldehyde dehydrogenase family protein n=1 Tax=Bradyrhizobium sp. F1.4.3 TaxID=3156356 RepID=UPI003394D21A
MHYQYPDCMTISTNDRVDPQIAFQSTRHNRPYSVGLLTTHLQNLRRRDFLAGGALVEAQWVTGGERDRVVDPATGEEIADAARCGAAEMEVAIAAAKRSFLAWRELLPVRRGAILWARPH